MNWKCIFGHKWYVTNFCEFKGKKKEFIVAPNERECEKCKEKQKCTSLNELKKPQWYRVK